MATSARSLTLLSKIVQCIANFQPRPKEEYMKDLSGRLLCEMDRMKIFLDFVVRYLLTSFFFCVLQLFFHPMIIDHVISQG